jgi:hypothetical protein
MHFYAYYYIYYYSIGFSSYAISMIRTMAIDEDAKSFCMFFLYS